MRLPRALQALWRPRARPLIVPARDFLPEAATFDAIRRADPWYQPCSPGNAMSELGMPSTYCEPTVMWRMQRTDGRQAQAVIDPMEGGARVVWFLNDQPLGVRYFDNWTSAIEWTEQLRMQYWTVGWRPLDDAAAGPASRSDS